MDKRLELLAIYQRFLDDLNDLASKESAEDYSGILVVAVGHGLGEEIAEVKDSITRMSNNEKYGW